MVRYSLIVVIIASLPTTGANNAYAHISKVGLTYGWGSGILSRSAITPTLTKGHTAMAISTETKGLVQAFYTACAMFIRGDWTASRGETRERTLKNGEVRTDKVFDIRILNGQVNGIAEVDSVVLVNKAKGEVALFVLTNQVGEGVTAQGIAYTLWAGTAVAK